MENLAQLFLNDGEEQPHEQRADDVTLDDLWIINKKQELVKFVANPDQARYLDEIVPGWRTGDIHMSGLRELVLKVRQLGMSTLIDALLFCKTINNPYNQTIILAHDDESSRGLFAMVKRFYDHLPPHKKKRTKYSTRTELVFRDIDSRIFVATAGSKEVGRSKTISDLHWSEVAMCAHGEKLARGLLQAVPKNGNVFEESTANGLGNYFHVTYEAAENGDSVFTPRFFDWFSHPEYRLPVLEDFQPTEDELELIRLYNLDYEQLAWRREKIKEIGLAGFKQEYPCSPKEAFLTSGNPYFDRDLLTALEPDCYIPETFAVPAGLIPAKGRETIKPQLAAVPQWNDGASRGTNRLKIWKAPVAGHIYTVTADTAEGVKQTGDRDFDSAHVFDCGEGEYVGALHGRWDLFFYAVMLAELGWWYNTALLCVERNTHGHTVISHLLHTIKYPEMNVARTSGLYFHETIDKKKQQTEPRHGWPTTRESKTLFLNNFATSLNNNAIRIYDLDTLREMQRFVHLPGGKFGGEAGSHDDRVISAALANEMKFLRQIPPPASPSVGGGGNEAISSYQPHGIAGYNPLGSYGQDDD